jgi:hypothetical protein
MREMRICLRKSQECKKMTRKQTSSYVKTIYKINFVGKYKDVKPTLSKSQREILAAVGVDIRFYIYNLHEYLGLYVPPPNYLIGLLSRL